MTDERLCKCDLCKREFTSTGIDWHFGADLIECKAINICDECWHNDNGCVEWQRLVLRLLKQVAIEKPAR
jgi:hypothetical protein